MPLYLGLRPQSNFAAPGGHEKVRPIWQHPSTFLMRTARWGEMPPLPGMLKCALRTLYEEIVSITP